MIKSAVKKQRNLQKCNQFKLNFIHNDFNNRINLCQTGEGFIYKNHRYETRKHVFGELGDVKHQVASVEADQ